MTIDDFVLYYLALFGFTYIVTDDPRMSWVKNWYLELISRVKLPDRCYLFVSEVFSCQICFMFWISLIGGFALKGISAILFSFAFTGLTIIIRTFMKEGVFDAD